MPKSGTDLRYDRVIFDVGGTLIGFGDVAPFQQFLTHAGLPDRDEDARRFHDELRANMSAERHRARGKGANVAELNNWWRSVFAKSLPGRDDLVEEMLCWLNTGRLNHLFNDAVPALQALEKMGMSMAILSNFGAHLHALLAGFDLVRFFDPVIVSAEVGVAKPDRRIFDLLAERLGYPRRRLLYVGDDIGDDIEGARGAGMDAVLIDRKKGKRNAPCPRISSLRELSGYVQPPIWPARAILLDMDGVVLASPPMHLLTWQRALAPLGIELTAEVHYPLEGLPTEVTAQRLTEHFLGTACSDREAQRLANVKRTLFREMFEPTCVPGIVPLLHNLRGRGYRLGLVTGSARTVVDESLSRAGVDEFFEIIVTGDDVVQSKPDPEPYRSAADRLGVPPSQCLAVENAPLGIRSAMAAGMACVALETTLPADRLRPVDQVFPDVESLRAWLIGS